MDRWDLFPTVKFADLTDLQVKLELLTKLIQRDQCAGARATAQEIVREYSAEYEREQHGTSYHVRPITDEEPS